MRCIGRSAWDGLYESQHAARQWVHVFCTWTYGSDGAGTGVLVEGRTSRSQSRCIGIPLAWGWSYSRQLCGEVEVIAISSPSPGKLEVLLM